MQHYLGLGTTMGLDLRNGQCSEYDLIIEHFRRCVYTVPSPNTTSKAARSDLWSASQPRLISWGQNWHGCTRIAESGYIRIAEAGGLNEHGMALGAACTRYPDGAAALRAAATGRR